MEIDDFRRSEGRMRDLVDDCDYIETALLNKSNFC